MRLCLVQAVPLRQKNAKPADTFQGQLRNALIANTAAPATCGVAMEVPLRLEYVDLHSVRMEEEFARLLSENPNFTSISQGLSIHAEANPKN